MTVKELKEKLEKFGEEYDNVEVLVFVKEYDNGQVYDTPNTVATRTYYENDEMKQKIFIEKR